MGKDLNETGYQKTQLIHIILVVILVFELFLWAYQCLALKEFILLVDSFNKISIGISGLLVIFLGQNWIAKEDLKEKKIKEYLKIYPHSQFGIGWEIVEPGNLPGAYYIYNKKTEMVHHILNWKTIYDLGWHVYTHLSKKISDDEFRSFKVGDRIRTQGEAGE